ncbi:hypothetical protein ACHQM5_030472 [Ranunculus cassubicifolius]
MDTKLVPEKIWVEVQDTDIKFWQPVEIGKIPKYCSHCRKIGHLINECTNLQKDLEKEKERELREKAEETSRKLKKNAQKKVNKDPEVTEVINDTNINAIEEQNKEGEGIVETEIREEVQNEGIDNDENRQDEDKGLDELLTNDLQGVAESTDEFVNAIENPIEETNSGDEEAQEEEVEATIETQKEREAIEAENIGAQVNEGLAASQGSQRRPPSPLAAPLRAATTAEKQASTSKQNVKQKVLSEAERIELRWKERQDKEASESPILSTSNGKSVTVGAPKVVIQRTSDRLSVKPRIQWNAKSSK